MHIILFFLFAIDAPIEAGNAYPMGELPKAEKTL